MAAYRESARSLLSALDAMPKPEPKRYRDCDGDTWVEQPDGNYSITEGRFADDSSYKGWEFNRVLRLGELTPLND